MNFKDKIKSHKGINNLRLNVMNWIYCQATRISPEFNTKLRYRMTFGRKLDLDNPKTLNEKILWLKLNRYMNDPLVIQCVDKYRVRDYVEKCGCGEILNDLIGVYERASDIPWDELPQQFVLKWNFGAGYNIICTDKSRMDKDSVIRQLDKWGKIKFWLYFSEMQYKYTPKRIICEKLISSSNFQKVGGGK